MTVDPELVDLLARVEHRDDGHVQLGDGSIVWDYQWRTLRSRRAQQRGEATKRARRREEQEREQRR